MKFKQWSSKTTKVFIVLGMILSMCFSVGNTKIVEAWDSGVPHEFTRVKSITYPQWWSRYISSLKAWSTYSCKYNGQWSYCLESSKKTPSSGNYTASVIENNANVRKLLYYGFGGPAASDVFAPDYNLKAGLCPDDSYLSNDDAKYLLTHIFLSGAYSGDWNGFNEQLFNKTFGHNYGTNIMNIYNTIISMPDPSNGASFSTGNTAKFIATYDKVNKQQITNIVTFNASSNETVQIPLQSDVTIHLAGTSVTQTSGTATIWGGQSFYLTTPITNSLNDYQSGNLTSSAIGKFCALAISNGNSSNQTHGSWYQETADSLNYSVSWLGFGHVDLKKTSSNTDITNNSSLYSLEGAKYGIYDGNELVEELTTDAKGYAKSSLLPEGSYTVKEIFASKGYDIDQAAYRVTIVKDLTTTVNATEKPKNDPIGIEIVKNDAETLEPQGDANLAGAEFTVKYYDGFYTKDNLPSKATRTWVLKTIYRTGKYRAGLNYKECIVSEKSDSLFYNSYDQATLPLGTISIEETKAPEGYFLKGAKLNVTDTASGTISSVTDGKYVAQINGQYQGAKLQFGNDANQMIVQEKVKKQRIQVFKSGEREGISGVVKGLQGAEFTWKLKSEVDNVGWDNAKTYAVITTNENGRAITDYLPYGKYLVRETKTPKDYMTAPDFTISVTKDSSEYNELEQIKLVSINNKPFASYVKLIKVDEDTGKKVTFNSASFKIKDSKGNYVIQKVSGMKVDTFTTNSDNEIIPVVEKGTVTLPLMLNAGTYTIEEIKTPKGFLDLEKPVEFVISSTYDYDVDEDADPIVEVKIKNRQPKGEIKLNKTVIDLDADTDLVNRTDLSKIQFILKARKDIYSSTDGSLLFKKDSVITTKNSGAVVNAGSEIGNGIYALSMDGHLDISNLPMSVEEASYYLQEVKTLDGCVLDTSKYEAVFNQEDSTTKTYIKSFNIVNETTYYEFNKIDVTGDKEVEGAQLTIMDEEGNVIDQWISSDKVHSIEGLIVGKIYTLSETVTAKDYVKATDIKFTVKNSSELETVTMKDKQVSFTKTDITGEKEVDGATITVTDKETGNIIDEWVSTKENHFINGLAEGKTYILSEKCTPEDYVKAADIEFTVSKEKVNQKVNMKDKQVEVSKITAGGKEVTGAFMQVIDQYGNVVDEWYSEGKSHNVSGLIEGEKYTLHEDLAPVGFNLANDIEFEVTEEKVNQTVEMVDTINEVSKVDENGKLLKGAEMTVTSNKTKNIIDKWISGQHIFDVTDEMKSQLKDKDKSKGTYFDEEDSMITYSIVKNNDKNDYTLMFTKDGVTTYSNIDFDGNETRHMIQGLATGEEYILKETKTPDGYATFKTQTFTVEESKDISLSMVDEDTKVEISKQDIITKKELEGAQLKVTDKDGKVIDEWVSGKQPHMIKNLTAGETYILTEVIAPKNYKVSELIQFTVKDTGKVQRVIMYDQPVKDYVVTGDINNYYFIVMFICLIVIYCLRKKRSNNFIN
nr:SpaA isopeptide-forming pilin-related protein [uncultured Faecalibacillus sp.]